jgi:hypothetical protein
LTVSSCQHNRFGWTHVCCDYNRFSDWCRIIHRKTLAKYGTSEGSFYDELTAGLWENELPKIRQCVDVFCDERDHQTLWINLWIDPIHVAEITQKLKELLD